MLKEKVVNQIRTDRWPPGLERVSGACLNKLPDSVCPRQDLTFVGTLLSRFELRLERNIDPGSKRAGGTSDLRRHGVGNLKIDVFGNSRFGCSVVHPTAKHDSVPLEER
jgi:hypothetical protein